MKPIDRIIFGAIAVALFIIALKPYFAEAKREVLDVNIAAVGGKSLSFGESIRVKMKR